MLYCKEEYGNGDLEEGGGDEWHCLSAARKGHKKSNKNYIVLACKKSWSIFTIIYMIVHSTRENKNQKIERKQRSFLPYILTMGASSNFNMEASECETRVGSSGGNLEGSLNLEEIGPP